MSPLTETAAVAPAGGRGASPPAASLPTSAGHEGRPQARGGDEGVAEP